MTRDPRHLVGLGELATLKNAIASWYHQDAFIDCGSHEEIWQDIRRSHDQESLRLLIAQIEMLLKQTDGEINAFWGCQSAYGFANETETRGILGQLSKFLSDGIGMDG